jgi:hypothetical protein
MTKSILIILFLFIGFGVKSQTLDSIPAKESANYYDKTIKVYGVVSGGRWLEKSFITLLNVDGNYPNHALTLMIKDIDRKKFSYAPEVFLKGKKILISGTVIKYKDAPEIIVINPDQIKIID